MDESTRKTISRVALAIELMEAATHELECRCTACLSLWVMHFIVSDHKAPEICPFSDLELSTYLETGEPPKPKAPKEVRCPFCDKIVFADFISVNGHNIQNSPYVCANCRAVELSPGIRAMIGGLLSTDILARGWFPPGTWQDELPSYAQMVNQEEDELEDDLGDDHQVGDDTLMENIPHRAAKGPQVLAIRIRLNHNGPHSA